MKKRIISFVLCVCILATMFVPVASVRALKNSLHIEYDGAVIDEISINYDEKKYINVAADSDAENEFQWQILVDSENGIWANILDKTEQSCEVSYALVKNILELSGEAFIRCKVTSEEGIITSDEVRVFVSFEEEVSEPVAEEMTLVSDMMVVDPIIIPEEENPSEEEQTEEEPSAEEQEQPSETEETEETEEESSETEEIEETEENEGTEDSSEISAGGAAAFESPKVASAYSSDSFAVGTLAEGEEKEYVTITIHYLDAESLRTGEDRSIYMAYVATIEKESAFEQNVVSPTYLGFTPVMNTDDNQIVYDEVNEVFNGGEDATVVKLKFAENELTTDLEYKVYYKPIEVSYGIRYFFQNINDDLYTEDAGRYHNAKAVTGTIITDEELQKHAGDTTGFEKMYHIPEAVAADGSTVFEVYYDRNYYLIQFDFNGGFGSDPIYARYGTPFVVNDPVRYGYVFGGWDLIDEDGNGDGVADEMPATIPAKNMKYKALWSEIDTEYTVAYWIHDDKGTDSNEDDDIFEFIGSRKEDATSGKKVSGTNDLGTSGINTDSINMDQIEFEKADQGVTVAGDGSTVVNVYYKYTEYTLRFYYAMSTGSGTNIKYYVVGGSTYYFGSMGETTDNSDEKLLLRQYASGSQKGQTGEVYELPTLNDLGKERNYTKGEVKDTVNGTEYTYYYISFTAPYNSDIGELWPCAVFDSVTRKNKDDANGWSGTEAFVSAWNGEHNVRYSLDPSVNNGNQTIKGKYRKLDDNLLWYNGYNYNSINTWADDSNTVSFLCFWENGANIGWSVPELYRYSIYYEVYEGQDTTGLTTKEYKGTTYYLAETYDTCDDSSVNQQTIPAIDGFETVNEKPEEDSGRITDYDESLYREAWYVNFYYNREKYNLSYANNGETAKKDDVEVAPSIKGYDTPIDFFIPDYPGNLEPNAYVFEGWYSTANFLENSKIGEVVYDTEGNVIGYDEGDYTMPASNLRLNAKWVPKTHTVRFFTTRDEMTAFENGTEITPYEVKQVAHGNVVGSIDNPSNTNAELAFGGWFYIENGEKKAFTPNDFPVKRDMNVFADWGSKTKTTYRISYVLKEDPTVKVADDSTGFAYVGTTRTFNAKAGDFYNQLYDFSSTGGINYNNGYFPIIASHSITMELEADTENPENAQKNVHTFEYVKAEKIRYVIKYVNKETGEVWKTEPKTTNSSVVTERFVAYEGYIPDAFYKRLVLSVEVDENGNVIKNEDGEAISDSNVITFYYTPNKTSAYYAVHFMLEKLDATDETRAQYNIDGSGGYESTGTHIEGIGDVDKETLITPQKFDGFTLIPDKGTEVHDGTETVESTNTDGKYSILITENGTELYIFYERNSYPYEVLYYLYNTTDKVPTATDSEGNPTAFFPHKASAEDNTLLQAKYGSTITETAPSIAGYTCVSKTTQSIEIRTETSNDKVEQNKIIFYYSPTQYTVEYVAVPPEGGWLSNTIEVKTGSESFEGSLPNVNENYAFMGWYLDEECTMPVTNENGIVEDDGRFVPDKDKLSETERNIFYAKFELMAADFTITRENAADDDQVFIYEVKSSEDEDFVITVTIVGNGSVTIRSLPMGKYTVTQKKDWSWRYTDSAVDIEHNTASGTEVVFDDAEGNIYWLSGNSKLLVNKKEEETADDT